MEEIFNPVVGWEDLYEASNLGYLISKRTGKKLNGSLRNGYIISRLSRKGFKKNYSEHRIILEAFIGNNDEKLQVNHIDGNKLNNELSNLEWVTQSENMLHSYRVLNQKKGGLGRFGKLSHRSKPIIQYDLNGNFIKEHESMNLAQKETNANNISLVVNGKNKQSGGFIWKYKI